MAACTSATSPDGKIYQVAADGTSKTFFDPDDKYIWALAVDADGDVFAATGEKGVDLQDHPGRRTATLFYKANTTNVVSLAIDRSGNLIAGTESPGRVFRIDRERQGVRPARLAVQGDPRAERRRRRRDLRRRDERRPRGGERRAADRTTRHRIDARAGPDGVGRDHGVAVVEAVPTRDRRPQSVERGRGGRGTKGAIYRIRPDGLWDTMWETGDDCAVRSAGRTGGSLLVGTGTEGKMFRV